MVVLTLAGREIGTVFDLLGQEEDDLTYSLGWAFANSPALTGSLLRAIFARDVGAVDVVALQEWDASRGITDIEILTRESHVIIEAKRGWRLPGLPQLEKYADRLSDSPASERHLLALTECRTDYARRHLPEWINGVKIDHLSWQEVVGLAGKIQPRFHAEKRLLQDVIRYLRGVVTIQRQDSNWVYCVSLGKSYREANRPATPIGMLRGRDTYFHPYDSGAGWPKTPPNYFAMRWDGKVQEIRHVEGYVVVDDLHETFSDFPSVTTEDMRWIVYDLGPSIPMVAPLPCGANYRAARLWIALDLLLTAPTLKQAYTETHARLP